MLLLRSLAGWLAVAALGAGLCHAQIPGAGTAGRVELVDGMASITGATGARRTARAGELLYAGEAIETARDGELHVLLADGGYLALRPGTTFRIRGLATNGRADDQTALELVRGAMRAVTGWVAKVNPRAYVVHTPTATIGVRGTDFEAIHIPRGGALAGEIAGTHVRVHDGSALLQRPEGELEVTAGRAAYAAAAGGPPRLHDGVPGFVSRRAGRRDGPVALHDREIGRHMEQSLRTRNLLRAGETASDYIRRRQGEFDPAPRTGPLTPLDTPTRQPTDAPKTQPPGAPQASPSGVPQGSPAGAPKGPPQLPPQTGAPKGPPAPPPKPPPRP